MGSFWCASVSLGDCAASFVPSDPDVLDLDVLGTVGADHQQPRARLGAGLQLDVAVPGGVAGRIGVEQDGGLALADEQLAIASGLASIRVIATPAARSSPILASSRSCS